MWQTFINLAYFGSANAWFWWQIWRQGRRRDKDTWASDCHPHSMSSAKRERSDHVQDRAASPSLFSSRGGFFPAVSTLGNKYLLLSQTRGNCFKCAFKKPMCRCVKLKSNISCCCSALSHVCLNFTNLWWPLQAQQLLRARASPSLLQGFCWRLTWFQTPAESLSLMDLAEKVEGVLQCPGPSPHWNAAPPHFLSKTSG